MNQTVLVRRIATLFLFCALFAGLAAAQDVSGSIVGVVTDATGSGVANARVTVTNTERNAVVRTTDTDSSGNYSAPLLSVGTYSVTVELKGFKKYVQKDIILNANDKLTANVKLEL